MSFIDESWRQAEPELKREWEKKHRAPGEAWSDVRDGFRFGWEAALRPEFRGRSWADAQEDLAQHWYAPEEPTDSQGWRAMRDKIEAGWRLSRRWCRPRDAA